MGYYSTITTKGLKIKDQYIDQVKKDIAICKQYSPNYLGSFANGGGFKEHPNFRILRDKTGIEGDYVFWHIAEMVVDDENYISWEDDGKFYGDKDLAHYLKDKVTRGEMNFLGEDGAEWGYIFDGNGGLR